jgi:hypothetical protein
MGLLMFAHLTKTDPFHEKLTWTCEHRPMCVHWVGATDRPPYLYNLLNNSSAITKHVQQNWLVHKTYTRLYNIILSVIIPYYIILDYRCILILYNIISNNIILNYIIYYIILYYIRLYNIIYYYIITCYIIVYNII